MTTDPNSPDDPARCRVTHLVEIEGILRDIRRAGSLVSIQGENDRDLSLSRLLGADPGRGAVWLDYGPDETINGHIATSKTITLSTTLDGVHIQFTASTPEKVDYQGEPAWRIAWPGEVQRLQRREFYRLGTSLVNPIRCLIDTPEGRIETTVMDISIGGVAVLAYEDGRLLRAGQEFHGCRIALPDVAGEINFSLRVINTYDVRLKNGRKSHRAGCQFVNLPASIETEIQRYIIKTERERRSRYV